MQSEIASEVPAVGREAIETVTRQPELIAVVAAALVFAGGVWWYLRPDSGDRFVDAITDHDRITVLMHPNPDPDAMASAMAVGALARAGGTAASIQYPGQIRHPENRAFETVLDCEFEHVEGIEDLAAETVVLVDHNEPRGFQGADDIVPHAVVDHHPGNGEGAVFTDIRTDRGSCASILTDYVRERGWSNRPDADGQSLTPVLATGLLYGIQSDTTSFTRGCTHAEFDAAAYLFPAADPDSLDRIANPQVDSETLEIKARAITRREIDGSFLVSHVGSVSNLDALPIAAEELIRLEGITAAVITGEHEGTLHISGRSRDDRVHMGKSVSTALNVIPDASAGGHARMGGGQAMLPASAPDCDGQGELRERFFAAMSGEL
ncbi:DHH family phosphoesterase [Natronomonas sp. F2-12]|jgi:nanoRNase/pAp phosphatase (c-di-AMP/oligoRNAs hydrolase)|uniref:DHH family phosphoesterase n=1 Tax=Natronomonas aquatica TaxID=2841590 RepID=A0A9R1D4X2_9EURY|nr:DHH family phosphoesterase [Natronomonas aquatica]MCQ4333794.1 DHH family phosphoesterase [Natronomonas aquatica]